MNYGTGSCSHQDLKVEQTQDQTHYKVHLGDLFDGPMDLLVHLVKKNEVDIYDIPIALITQQYIEYLEWMKSLNIDVAGEFLVMAATLAHIKSRMLLPTQGEEVDDEDPRMEIVRPLAEFLQLKYGMDYGTQIKIMELRGLSIRCF